MPENARYNIVMVGDAGVGKTSLVNSHDKSNPHGVNCRATVGMDFKVITIYVERKPITLHIWDTSGQERFSGLYPQYFRHAHGVLLVYDVSSKTTFDRLSWWFEQIEKYAPEKADIIIVGNKIDLMDRQVTREEGLHLARMKNCQFIETTAYTGDGITHVLEKLVLKMQPRQVCYPKPDVIRLCPKTYDVAVTKQRGCWERMC